MKGKLSKGETQTAQSYYSEVVKRYLGSENSKGEIVLFPCSGADSIEALNVLLATKELSFSFVSVTIFVYTLFKFLLSF